MNRAAVAAALLCAACGNYSTEDLEFLSALPHRSDLRAEVPAGSTSSGLASCPGGRDAVIWQQSKPASDQWNAGVELVVGLVDVVRGSTPTWRREDERGWGPFPDERHPGVQIQVVMKRDYPPTLGGEPRYTYAFQARRRNTTSGFTSVITGAFEGPSSTRGKGRVVLDFAQFWNLGMNDADTPLGTAFIGYDRTGDPVRIFLGLYDPGFATPQFVYAFKGWGNGSGRFAYRFRESSSGNVFTVATSYDAAGAGRDVVTISWALGSAQVRQCWDAAACLTFVDDPLNLTCPAAEQPCSGGIEADCATTIPEAPDADWGTIDLAP